MFLYKCWTESLFTSLQISDEPFFFPNLPWREEADKGGRDYSLGAFQFQLFQLFQIPFSHATPLLIYYITT